MDAEKNCTLVWVFLKTVMEKRKEKLNSFGLSRVTAEGANPESQGEATVLATCCHFCSLTLRSLPPVFHTTM